MLFGLSMDYLVFLVSRIQEEWHQLHHTSFPGLIAPGGRATRRNHQAVTVGLAGSGRIIAGAASIMILVFGSFLLGGHRILAEFGFALGFSVLIGPANWALPGWLDRLLPRLAVEAGDQLPATDPEEVLS